MIKSIDDLMYINDGNNPFRTGFIYGTGGLGYKPYLGISGGVVIVRDTINKKEEEINGKITDIIPYNEDDKRKLLTDNDFDKDIKDLDNHLNYLTGGENNEISKEVKEYIDNLPPEKKNEIKMMIMKDMDYLREINTKGLQINSGLSQVEVIKDANDNIKEILLERPKKENTNEDKIKKLNDKIKEADTQINKLLQEIHEDPDIYKLVNESTIVGLNKTKELYRNKINELKGAETINIKPELATLKELAPERKLPERYKFTSKDIRGFVRNLNHELEEENIKYEKYGITDEKFKKKIVPTGGAKAYEDVMENDKDVQKAVYKALGIPSDNPQLENFQNQAGNNTSLPVDMIDIYNKLLMELKKYVKYDYNELINDLFNSEIKYLQNKILMDINAIIGKKDFSYYDKNDILELSKLITDENGKIDRNKTINYLKKNYGGVSIPIGVQKFGNTGEFTTPNRLNDLNTKKYVESQKNDRWDIKIDYRDKIDGVDNPNYGKVIKLQQRGTKLNYSKEPQDYIFTIATKNELLTFNYSKYIRDNKIKSPLDAFKVGDDFYDATSEGASYYIPIDLFTKVEKTSFINPELKEDFVFDLLEAEDISKYPETIQNKINFVKSSKSFKKYESIMDERIDEEIELSELLEKFDIVSEDLNDMVRKKGELKAKILEEYPLTKGLSKTEKEKIKQKRDKYINKYDEIIERIKGTRVKLDKVKSTIINNINK
jgi:exonuclease SbcC